MATTTATTTLLLLGICVSAALAQVVVVDNAPTPGTGYILGHNYTLICQGTLNSGCNIQWQKDGDVLSFSGSRIVILALPRSSDYVCSFVCSGISPSRSATLTITGQNLVKVDILNAGSSGDHWTPLVNTDLDLSCRYELFTDQISKAIERNLNPTYEWTVDGGASGTLSNLAIRAEPGYDRMVQCKVTYGTEELTSAPVRIEASSEVDPPEVIFKEEASMNDANFFRTSTSYVAYCQSKSHNSGVSYLWTRDYFTIPAARHSRSFQIQSANRWIDDGLYRCRMTLDSQEICSRNAVSVQVQDAGRVCQSDGECLGEGYIQSCRNNRCECAEGFTQSNDECSGVSPLIASGVVLIITFILSRLF